MSPKTPQMDRIPWYMAFSSVWVVWPLIIRRTPTTWCLKMSIDGVLGPRFLTDLLKAGYDIVPHLTVEDINDKSKADGLVKGFTCIQALWFCLQVVTRFAQSLPITLLELNTFAHAICALLVYLLWWEKPLDVAEPIWLRTDQDKQIQRLCAHLSRHYAICFYEAYQPAEAGTSIPHQSAKGRLFILEDSHIFTSDSVSDFDRRPYSDPADDWMHATLRRTSAAEALPPPHSTSDQVSVKPNLPGPHQGAVQPAPASQNQSVLHLKLGEQVPGLPYTIRVPSAEVDQGTLIRMRCLAEPFPHRELMEDSLYENVSDFSDIVSLKQNINAGSFAKRVEDWCRSEILDGYQITALAMSGLAYGGLHMLAWGTAFHTHAESILWAVSALTILCFVPASIVVFAIYDVLYKAPMHLCRSLEEPVRRLLSRLPLPRRRLSPKADKKKAVKRMRREHLRQAALRGEPRRPEDRGVFEVVMVEIPYLAALLTYVFYVACRIFIIVEVFIALPFADPAVFQTPNWTLYFPHVG